MPRKYFACILGNSTDGYYVEWYRDDDYNSGLGANPQVTWKNGTHKECFLTLLREEDPSEDAEWHDL
jgi:hypothetical protein